MNKSTKTRIKIKGKDNPFYIYGKNPVMELLINKPNYVSEVVFIDFGKDNNTDKHDFSDIIKRIKNAKIPTRYLSKREAGGLLDMSSDGVNTQRVLAKIKSFDYLDFKQWRDNIKQEEKLGGRATKLVLVLDKVEDPHNFGAIVRSAGAVGVSAVFVANAGQSPVNATVFKTSAGVITKVPIVQVANISDTLEKLKDLGFWNYGVDMHEISEEEKEINLYAEGSKSMWEQKFDSKTVLVVGAEGSGLSRIAKEHCDFLIHIPMKNNVESLNVSVAAALSMYEWRRQFTHY